MSHQPERKEKDCLNCNVIVHGRYCHVCGQENIVIKQGFWSLFKHFVYDIFHFDGKFFDTMKYMFTRPGKVAKEYIAGKRMHYLDPIRMYLFTSAIFFLVFFSTRDASSLFTDTNDRIMSKAERLDVVSNIYHSTENGIVDSADQKKLKILLDSSTWVLLKEIQKSKPIDSSYLVQVKNEWYTMSLESQQDTISADGNNWVAKRINERWQKYRSKHADDPNKIFTELADTFLHKLPYLLFISLPLFALILKLLYVRRRKVFFYSDHAIFTLYHYIFSFILLLFFFGFDALEEWLGWGIFSFLNIMLLIIWPVYLYISLKRFYGQKWLKTFFKFLLINFLGIFTLLVLFLLFLFASFLF